VPGKQSRRALPGIGVVLLLLGFSAWSVVVVLAQSRASARAREATDVIHKLEALELALSEMKTASLAIEPSPDVESSFKQWRSLYINFRRQVNQLDGKNPTVQRIIDPLVQTYTYVSRSEKIRQELMTGADVAYQTSALESEFRSNLNLALAEIRRATTYLRHPAPPQWAPTQAYAGFGGTAAILAGALLVLYQRRQARAEQLQRMFWDVQARCCAIEDNVGEGILTLDGNGDILGSNAAIERLFGYDAVELTGTHIHDLLREPGCEDSSFAPSNSARATMARRKNGEEFPVEVVNLLQPNGASIVVVRDVPRVQESEALMTSQERMKLAGQLAGCFAHNFNHLLTYINGYADLLLNTVEQNSPLRRELEYIVKAGKKAAELTAQLQAISGKQALNPSEVDLNSLIASVARQLTPLMPRDLILETSFDPALGRVDVDRERFKQVLFAVAYNARDAMPNGGRLEIETANLEIDGIGRPGMTRLPAGRYARVTLRDTGRGMDRETLDRLFEPFFTTKKPGRGAGLGLATSWGIVHQSGGTIQIESVPDAGTTVNIYLPRAVNAAGPRSRPESLRSAKAQSAHG
jgi:PAS domain S-box-containing protein